MARRNEEDTALVPEVRACVRYTGGESGDLYIMGVPTTDLHDLPAEEAARLAETGLYVLNPDCSHGE